MLRAGKHRGKTFENVAAEDRGYCSWVLREQPSGFSRFAKYLRSRHGGIVNVGRYRHKFFKDVAAEDEDY